MPIQTATLTDRYIDAALRAVPERQRADLDAELRERIADEIEARTGDGAAESDAEYAVLAALGDPEKLAAEYIDRPLQLIGPRYYLAWWRLLKLLWTIVPACAVFGVTLGLAISGASFGEIMGTIWPVLISVVVHIGFWTTLVFAIVERSAAGADVGFVGEWKPEQLPERRERGAAFSDMIGSLVFLVIAAGAFLWDRFIGFVPGHPGLSFFAPDLWPWWMAGLFLLMVLEGALAVVVYRMGHWTTGAAVVNAVLSLAVAVPAIWLLTQGLLVNPEIFTTIAETGDAAAQEALTGDVPFILGTITGFGIAAIAGWDIFDGFRKARRTR